MWVSEVSIVVVEPEGKSGENSSVNFRRILVPLFLRVVFEDLRPDSQRVIFCHNL